MKKGWQTSTLASISSKITDGSHNPPKGGAESDYLMLSSKNVFDDDLHYEDPRYLTREHFEQEDRRTGVAPNDVLLTIVGTIGRSAVVPSNPPRITLQRSVAVIRPDGNIVEPRFLMYSFIERKEDLNAHARGVAQKGIYLATLRELEVAFPPLTEQRRIVGLLDEAFDGLATAKANAEKNLQNARAIFESHLQSVLRNREWKWKTLGELCEDVEYGSSAKSKAEGAVPVLRMGNIQAGRLDWTNLVYTDDKDEIKKFLLKHNDVLFNRTNSPALVGKTAIYKSEMPAIFAGYLIRIYRKEDLLDADFLTYFLNSQIAFDYGNTVVISSVNQANINGTKLKSYPIPAPTLAEQKAIVAELDALSEETQRLAQIYEQKLTALDELKKSLLHQAFSGQM